MIRTGLCFTCSPLFDIITISRKWMAVAQFKAVHTVSGPEHTGHFVQPQVAAHCGGDIYSRRKPLFSSFGEHTAVCGSSGRQAVARPRHRQSVCIHNIHVAATCRPSVLRARHNARPHVVKQSGQCARALILFAARDPTPLDLRHLLVPAVPRRPWDCLSAFFCTSSPLCHTFHAIRRDALTL